MPSNVNSPQASTVSISPDANPESPSPVRTSSSNVDPPQIEAPHFDPAAIEFTASESMDRTQTFQSDDKQFSVEAVFLALRNETVYLKRTDSEKVIQVPIEKLSVNDRIWIRKIAAADKASRNSMEKSK